MPRFPVLAWLAIVRDGDVFVAVLIACLIGDVVDGRLARALNATSSLGAQLDSIADTLLFLAAAGGIAVFHAEVISKHAVVFTLGSLGVDRREPRGAVAVWPPVQLSHLSARGTRLSTA